MAGCDLIPCSGYFHTNVAPKPIGKHFVTAAECATLLRNLAALLDEKLYAKSKIS